MPQAVNGELQRAASADFVFLVQGRGTGDRPVVGCVLMSQDIDLLTEGPGVISWVNDGKKRQGQIDGLTDIGSCVLRAVGSVRGVADAVASGDTMTITPLPGYLLIRGKRPLLSQIADALAVELHGTVGFVYESSWGEVANSEALLLGKQVGGFVSASPVSRQNGVAHVEAAVSAPLDESPGHLEVGVGAR